MQTYILIYCHSFPCPITEFDGASPEVLACASFGLTLPNVDDHSNGSMEPEPTWWRTGSDLTQWPRFLQEDPNRFQSYAPALFQKLRSLYGIQEEEFATLLKNSKEDPDKRKFSEGKSNSFFFYSKDDVYMVKTLNGEEFRLLKRILPSYYRYMVQNPQSLLCRFFGLYSIKMYGHTGTVFALGV